MRGLSKWRQIGKMAIGILVSLVGGSNWSVYAQETTVERFGIFEQSAVATGKYENSYIDLAAKAEIRRPDGTTWTIPLFWDGETCKFRVSPDTVGEWKYTIRSVDSGLQSISGRFMCIESQRDGSIRPMKNFPHHFQYQSGRPLWFFGDTAWSLFVDNAAEKLDRQAIEEYIRIRAGQGFNVLHSAVVSEAGLGNIGGPPFQNLEREELNPAYFQELDRRLAYANENGLVVGLVLAWADKGGDSRYSWRKFPNVASRKRFASYVASRYSAYGVYFIVSGEWQGEVKTRPADYEDVREEFIQIGAVLNDSDPHDRMIGIHPIEGRTDYGTASAPNWTVSNFQTVDWMSFGDYQQNYHDLHTRILEMRVIDKPVVNAEYGYHLRDRDSDGVPDKDNSTSLEAIRHASWDIAMAGGYFITGFGTTYFGGERDPNLFDIHAAQNDEWELQVGWLHKLFSQYEWWKLEPHDEWLRCVSPRGQDGTYLKRAIPPPVDYWLLSEPGHCYLVYARGVDQPLTIDFSKHPAGTYRASLFNPRSGEQQTLSTQLKVDGSHVWTPPDANDWLLVLELNAPLAP